MRAVVLLLLLMACVRQPEVVSVSCADPQAGCRLNDSIDLRFSRVPSVMQEFDLEVRSSGKELHAGFQMHGMEMGLNRYRLLRDGDRWRATVMLPACVQGRRDWLLRLEVDGVVYEVPFVAG